ncbi:unnamed protein product [Caenorhabditis auriculariae]|uniref:Actin-like protein 6A n=1 Tax=Caenorhabditis auriculariae TaxID=2777116 RepID=A0A8S1HV25_9PELO|nr:unnamed protein product [Caenorhabditis auriculariae]
MSGGIYGGDDVSGLVFDAGSHTFRVGFAGEEYPKGDTPSFVAIQEPEPDEDVEMKENAEKKTSNVHVKRDKNVFIGTTKIIVPRARTNIQGFMKDGMIDDWDIFENLVEYNYNNILYSNPQEHPVLFTESAWNERSKRERLTELMFEKFQVPAFFLSKNAVLTTFSNGRTGGLIVDSGATHTSVVPVHDGYAVTNAVVRSPLGGDLITEQLDKMLAEQGIDVVPTYKIASKEEVEESQPPRWTPKKNLPAVTESYDKFMRKQVLEDMSASILQLCDATIDLEYADKLPSTPYSLPNGFTKEFMAERIKVPECLFDLKYLKNTASTGLMPVAQMAAAAAGMSDIDIRPSLYSAVTLTGGNSLILGFAERLNHELAMKCPPTIKLRVSAAPTSTERRFSAWIGGSILASLGSFQQMWIGKSEYEETGRIIVDKKCP